MRAGLLLLAMLVALFALFALAGAPARAAGSLPTQAAPGDGPGAGGATSGGGLMETVIPGAPCGPTSTTTPPLSDFTIDYDEGGLTAISRKAVGTLTDLTFATVRWVVGIGMWLVQWAFSFGIANRLAAPMAAAARRYQDSFFSPLLASALFLSAAWAAWQVFRGRTGRGLGEISLSLVLVAVFTTWVLADPLGFLGGSLRMTAGLAGAVSQAGLPTPPPGCAPPPGSFAIPALDAAVAPMTSQIEQSFVVQPYQLIEWGGPVPAACAGYAQAILEAKPSADRDLVVQLMNQPPCTALYAFNRQPSTERLGVAVLVLVACSVLIAALVAIAGTVIAAQVIAVGLIAFLPFAALAAALPGAGWTLLWYWATGFLRARPPSSSCRPS